MRLVAIARTPAKSELECHADFAPITSKGHNDVDGGAEKVGNGVIPRMCVAMDAIDVILVQDVLTDSTYLRMASMMGLRVGSNADGMFNHCLKDKVGTCGMPEDRPASELRAQTKLDCGRNISESSSKCMMFDMIHS